MRYLALVLLLAGCAHTRVVEVAKPCVTETIPPPPAMPALTGQAQADILIIAAQALRWRGYAEALAVQIEACRG